MNLISIYKLDDTMELCRARLVQTNALFFTGYSESNRWLYG